MEELKQANRLKLDFLSTLSHELRTPLTIIMGYTELLLDEEFGPLTVEQSRILLRIKKVAYEELETISAVLDISHLEAGRLSVELIEVDVAELLEELKQEVDQIEEKPGLHFTWRVTPQLQPLRTDRTKLKVVLKNLLSNIVKITKQGSVTVEAHPQNNGMKFCVTDTGITSVPEVWPRIFKRLRRHSSSMRHSCEGIGLGLYVIRPMLKLLGGTITVESQGRWGSTLQIWVPGRGGENRKEERM